MKRIDINGMGVWTEVYKRDEKLDDIQALREAAKAIVREVMRREQYEHRTNPSIDRQPDTNGI